MVRRRALVASLVLLVVVGLGYAVFSAYRAASSLLAVSDSAALLREQVSVGDQAAAQQTLVQLQADAALAHERTDGPMWSVGRHLPLLGDDVRAIQVVAEQTDVLATDALPRLVAVADQLTLQTFSPRDGRFDLDAIAAVVPDLTAAAGVLATADDEIGGIDPEGLVGRLRVPVTRLAADLSTVTSATQAAERAGLLLPEMLGGEGRREYLLLMQNNAEIRSLGGIPGSFAVITAEDGRLEMGRQGSILDVFPDFDSPVVELTDEERSIFPTTLATDLRDTTITPDFPRAADIASRLVGRSLDTTFDGVLSVDAVTLSYLLDGVGPLELVDGTVLTSGNAVDELLNRVYVRFEGNGEAQDALFADAARRVFDAFTGGAANAPVVVQGLVRAASDGRVLVWSADPQLEERIAETGLSGALPTSSTRPDVGVYVSDAIASKLEYYLDTSPMLRATTCEAGVQTMRLGVRLSSEATEDVADLPLVDERFGLPEGLPRGDMALNVRVFGPVEGELTELRVNGQPQSVAGGTYEGRPVAVVPVTISPGSAVNVEMVVTSGPDQTGDPRLSRTPGLYAARGTATIPSACG